LQPFFFLFLADLPSAYAALARPIHNGKEKERKRKKKKEKGKK
jgi:hypothetical protein